ncbi:probable metal-nicotianamine transporter YSL7 [Salvia hispanica]|uniref:probable metal-nicotianamine transporter YSL7 n=1 Tax=Salvia hispanica TaxID=49212 RepID=UPI00200968A1|nr:probable metal-nicotianamine transporter YSL7 [Salvia hispanica]
MSEVISNQISEDNSPQNTKNPQLSWMIVFLFSVSFLGLFTILPLRKIMIIDYRLTFPSGTAAAHLINSFHSPKGAKLAKKQGRALGKFFTFSFLWGLFQWFFTATYSCGFSSFPTFGLKAYDNTFYFDFSASYVGIGMLCSYSITISMLVGAILSWGFMWQLINNQKGDWYSADYPSSSHEGRF